MKENKDRSKIESPSSSQSSAPTKYINNFIQSYHHESPPSLSSLTHTYTHEHPLENTCFIRLRCDRSSSVNEEQEEGGQPLSNFTCKQDAPYNTKIRHRTLV